MIDSITKQRGKSRGDEFFILAFIAAIVYETDAAMSSLTVYKEDYIE